MCLGGTLETRYSYASNFSEGSTTKPYLIFSIFPFKTQETDSAASWGFMSQTESDHACLFSSVLRRQNISFKSDAASSSLSQKWRTLACLMAVLTLFLACLYSSMWTSRPVFHFFHSACCLACFILLPASRIQAKFVQSGKTFSLSGTCLFRRSRRVTLYSSTKPSTSLEGSVTRGDSARSSWNYDLSMPFVFLNFTTFRRTHGLEGSVPITR